jgi:hypothetical protein
MSMPASWTEKIFMKLTLIYGRDFTGRWEGMNICDIKTDWSHELSGYENRPKAIAWALQNLPAGKPPTVLEFRKLCNTLPQEATVFIDAPKADPVRLKAVLAAMPAPVASSYGMKDWAHRLKARHEAGDNLNPNQIKSYQMALAA